MRGVWLGLVAGLAACSQGGPNPGTYGDDLDGGGTDWTDDPAFETYTLRFGGSIDMGEDGEVETGAGEGNGEEYTVITASDGTVECDWLWTTDALDAPLGDCVGCDVAWDVTCYDGHEVGGNCRGWMDPEASVGPMQFYLAFEPSEVVGGVEHGTVYVRGSLYDAWSPYAPATREGTVVKYEYAYEIY